MDKYGLVGKNISYSFSKSYFEKKFAAEGIHASYQNFDLPSLSGFREIIALEKNLKGLSVTIPYKEAILPFLDQLDEQAAKIGAVNTIQIKNKKLVGYNTDCFGFMKSLFPLLEKQHTEALILGTGGASKAIAHALRSLGIEYHFVSRNPTKNDFPYEGVTKEVLEKHFLIINCTPLGTHPNLDEAPNIPYEHLDHRHLLYDLVYNPPLTTFLANGKVRGCKLYNGQKMLEFQAERAWEIWNEA
ncbi:MULTISPECIES: shikimate dehydrogenase family protein [Mesonia]|uniref:Shikimate dehydrogenase (NADP(+)) n=1 Tax=Mesonia oceanica TaxID=2687242 RepID=A0AC61Y694_9FLAO|nr:MULTISPECIES: shikimate dehydrogenase [Mesonia]MAN27336.1 shikimate dehydrogenase [Mesonia sp.]MAQ42271.1 shikimate dehydrogenase [Mesonia sp.]MBJ98557.1 shikimate dehydrogenase [Flavobacteriaceae bacterium]VVV00027.1 Shikimate dehydrogenase (NADP(+)) [Mesonia oceanica]|tara:strand:- start:6190 stop:6921 length:732 start_codon:yes stop_codon:yes gene_type:complete